MRVSFLLSLILLASTTSSDEVGVLASSSSASTSSSPSTPTSSSESIQQSSSLPKTTSQEQVEATVIQYDREKGASASMVSTAKNHHHLDDSLDSFLTDVGSLSSLYHQLPVLQASHSKRDSSFTKTWTSDDWNIAQRPCWKRYRDHLASWYKSPTAVAVFPAVSMAVGWAALVVALSKLIPFVESGIQKSTFSKVEVTTAPIALLLTLRTNKGLDRLFEARAQWGIIVRALTQLSGMAATYISPHNPEAAMLFARYCSVYGWTLKGLFMSEDDSRVLQAVLPPKEYAFVTQNSADHPSAILFRLRSILASITGDVTSATHYAMETSLSDLERAFGICRRILGSPIPPTYTRHTSRVLCSYLALLPLSLVDKGVSTIAILLSAAIVSYVFVGIDEIGVEVEHPFPLLPLQSLCTKMERSVVNQFCMAQQLHLPSF